MPTKIPKDMKSVQTAVKGAQYALTMADQGLVTLSPEDRAVLERVQQGHQSALSRLARAAAAGRMTKLEVEQAFNQTRLMGRGVSKIILEMLFEKAVAGEACPYDAEVLKFLAKGFGIVSPSKPVDDQQRQQQANDAARLRAMTDQELADDILRTVRSTQDAAAQAAAEEKEAR